MVTEAEAFCMSCGVARNRGDKCDYCGRLYVNVAASKAGAPPVRALTSKYKLKKNSNETVISWRWRNKSTWFMIPFACIWIGMALAVGGGELLLTDPLAAFPVPLIPVLIGLFILLQAIVKMTNGTAIHASRQSLRIQHYPLPWRRNVQHPTSQIQQIFVSKVQRSDKERTWSAPVLQLVTKDNVRQVILSGSNDSQLPDFESLRLELLDALGIEPQAVAGAYDASK